MRNGFDIFQNIFQFVNLHIKHCYTFYFLTFLLALLPWRLRPSTTLKLQLMTNSASERESDWRLRNIHTHAVQPKRSFSFHIFPTLCFQPPSTPFRLRIARNMKNIQTADCWCSAGSILCKSMSHRWLENNLHQCVTLQRCSIVCAAGYENVLWNCILLLKYKFISYLHSHCNEVFVFWGFLTQVLQNVKKQNSKSKEKVQVNIHALTTQLKLKHGNNNQEKNAKLFSHLSPEGEKWVRQPECNKLCLFCTRTKHVTLTSKPHARFRLQWCL